MGTPVCFGQWYVCTTCYACEFQVDCRRAKLKPRVNYSCGENMAHATISYPSEMLDAMAEAISRQMEEAVFERMALARGYAKKQTCEVDEDGMCTICHHEINCEVVGDNETVWAKFCSECGSKVVR